MYVDESGDSGKINSPTKFYILSAIVVHEKDWITFLNDLVSFRRNLKKTKGLLMKEEIHCSEFISKRVKFKNNVSRTNRLDILKKCLDWLSSKPYLSVISVRVNKQNSTDPFLDAWTALLQRFENTLMHQNFPNSAFKTDSGIVISDDTDVIKLIKLSRKVRRINYIPNMGAIYQGGSRNLPMRFVIKDPIFRASSSSFILQMVDVVAYFVKQYYDPAKYVKQKGGRNWYSKLAPIINKKCTYHTGNFKIIRL